MFKKISNQRLFNQVIFFYLLVILLVAISELVSREDRWPFLTFYAQVIHYVLIGATSVIALWGLSLMRAKTVEAEKEKDSLEQKIAASSNELIAAYQHMGLINRQIETIKDLINNVPLREPEIDQRNFELISLNILGSAVASVGADWGILRFLNIKKMSTVTEIIFNPHNIKIPDISNNILIGYLKNKDAPLRYFLVTPDEKNKTATAFFIFSKNYNTSHTDDSFLKVFANQAQLIFIAFNRVVNR